MENYKFISDEQNNYEQKISEQVSERIRKLTFADDFVFYSVLAVNTEICREVIEACIGKPIERIVYTNGQEAMKLLAAVRGETVSDDGLDRKIAEAVERLEGNTRWRMDYITIDAQRMDYIRRGREEGRAEGREEGRAEGQRIGKLRMLYELVRDGMLSLSAAADKAEQTEEEFKTGMDVWLKECGTE